MRTIHGHSADDRAYSYHLSSINLVMLILQISDTRVMIIVLVEVCEENRGRSQSHRTPALRSNDIWVE